MALDDPSVVISYRGPKAPGRIPRTSTNIPCKKQKASLLRPSQENPAGLNAGRILTSRPCESQFPHQFRVKRRAEPAGFSRVFLRTGAIALQIQGQRHIVVDASVARLKPQSRPELRYRQPPQTRLEVQGAQIESRLRQRGFEAYCALEMGPRQIAAISAHIQRTQGQVRLGVPIVEPQGALQGGFGGGSLTTLHLRDP